ncbi:MAG: transcription elongation factor subunit Spt4 [Candidatus Woesearchaeota archaeon]
MKKVCKHCRLIVDEKETVCPMCNQSDFVEGYRGRIYVFNPDASEVSKVAQITKKGDFAIKLSMY